jgi:hypothetical protein
MPVVLITADIFHMGVFKGPQAQVYPKSFDQEGDRAGLFLVLQPFIFTGATSLGQLVEATWRHPHLNDYFTVTGPRLRTLYSARCDVILYGSEVSDARAVPVVPRSDAPDRAVLPSFARLAAC